MKAKFRISLIIMLFLSLILISTNVYAKTGTTINDTTRVRTEASTSSDTVVLLSINTEVEIVGESGDWYQVKYNSYTGYIRKDLLDVPETSEEETNTEASTATSSTNDTTDTNAVVDESSSENETESTEENETVEENASQSENSEETTTRETNTVEVGYKGNLTTSLSMRILPSINSSIITEISANTEFTVIEIINNWCYIETDSFSGWVFLSKLTTQGESKETEGTETEESSNETNEENTTTVEETATATTKYVSAETLNMREKAETSGNVIAQLSLNTEVTVVEEVDSTWSKITYNGKTGYVASQYLSDTKTTTTSRSETLTRASTTTSDTTTSTTEDTTATTESTQTSSSSTGAEVVSLAKQYLGYKYVSGGASPSTGFDCSGFTYYIYKQFGVTLSRTSSGQASNGTAVSKSDLQPGDIVVFNNSANTSIGHVGIYIGSNTFIHAANSTKGVITTSLSDSYYSARYVTARRIFN